MLCRKGRLHNPMDLSVNENRQPSARRVIIIVLAATLLVLLSVCALVHPVQQVLQYSLFAGVAVLAPLTVNLAVRSRALAFSSGPVLVICAVLLSAFRSPETLCWFPLAAPLMVFYTAPAWILSWMITDRRSGKH